MRVPFSSYPNSLVTQLQGLTSRQSKLQSQAATGQRITNPCDDPAATARVLRIQAEKQQTHQFASNNARAAEINETSFSAVEQLKNVSDRAGELSVLGSGVASADAYRAYSTETNQLIEQALQVANSKFGGEYLFAGTRTDAAPFVASRDTNGNITSVTYEGAATAAEFRIGEDATLSPYTSGTTNQQIAGFLNHLVSLRDALGSQDPAQVTAARQGVQTSEDHLLVTLSDLGAVQSRLEVNDAQNTARFAKLDDLTASDTDADLAQTIVKLTQAQTAYQAALQSGAQIMHMSLLDYLR
jgi:flagellar hook-associated protein 3 FlgL